MSVEVDYAKIEDYPEGGDRLFKIMMRLEFSLKEIGYSRAANSNSVEVDWDRFSNISLGRLFFEKIKESGKAKNLIQYPPKLQSIVEKDRLDWVEKGEVSNIQELIGALRRVRNNLFHGGKSGDVDSDRNKYLVSEALLVVDYILQNDENLRNIFEGKY